MNYKNYLETDSDKIDYILIDENNKIIINELKEIFKKFNNINVIGKGDSAIYLKEENTIAINQALIFTNYKYLFINDFESLFGIEHLICQIKYLFFPSYLHINCGSEFIKFIEILDFLKIYNFKGKIFIYELNTSQEKGKLKLYNIHQHDTTLTAITFFKKFLDCNQFVLYGCYKTNNYHDKLLNLNYKLNEKNKYSIYIEKCIKMHNNGKKHGRQSTESLLTDMNIKYTLN